MSEHIKNMADSCGQTAENESLATSRDSLKIWAFLSMTKQRFWMRFLQIIRMWTSFSFS